MTRNSHPVNPDFQQSSDILISLAPNTTFESAVSVSPSYPHTLASRGGHKLLRPRPCRGKFSVWAVVSILSLVTILAVLALCRTSQRRLDSGGAERRRLSDTEDDRELSEIVEQCLDLEQELGLQPAVVEHVEEASEAKSRLVGMLYDSAAAFENMNFFASQRLQDDAHSPPYKIPRLNESRPSTSHPQESVAAFWPHISGEAMHYAVDSLGAAAWPRTEYDLVVDESGEERHMAEHATISGLPQDFSGYAARPSAFYAATRPQDPFYSGRTNSGGYGLTPDAWLDDSQAHTYPQAFQQRIADTAARQPTMESTSAASTSAGFTAIHSDLAGRVYSGVPHGDGGHEIAWPSSQMRAEQQLEQPEDGFEVTLDAVAKSESAAAARAGSDGSAEPSYPGNIHLHPFVRLPEVNPKDIHGVFRKEFALAPYFGRFSPMDSYMTLRRLFAKASLTAKDIGTLIKEAEILANYATERLASPCSKCTASYLVRKLSSLLMVFDHLVCALELLGDKMDAQSWWAEFVRKFHTDYHLPEAGRTRRARFLSRLVNRLSSALSVYKEGRRPALGEVIDLKRAIIAEANAEGQLTNPLWELWMDDDKAFFSSSSDSERPSDV